MIQAMIELTNSCLTNSLKRTDSKVCFICESASLTLSSHIPLVCAVYIAFALCSLWHMKHLSQTHTPSTHSKVLLSDDRPPVSSCATLCHLPTFVLCMRALEKEKVLVSSRVLSCKMPQMLKCRSLPRALCSWFGHLLRETLCINQKL